MPKIIRQEVRTFISNLVCETCKEGFMQKVATEMSTIDLTCNPPKYKHLCSKCGHVDWIDTIYPAITYEYVDTTPA